MRALPPAAASPVPAGSRRGRGAIMAAGNVVGRNWPLITIGLTALMTTAAVVVLVGNLPPGRIVVATGPQDGAYHVFGRRYREELARAGVRVAVRTTEGSQQNLDLLRDPRSGVSAALIQGGTVGGDDAGDLETLGTVLVEPLWLFHRPGVTAEGLNGLRGRTIAVGPAGSGTMRLVLSLLQRHGIDGKVSRLLPLETGEAGDRLAAGEIDALFMVASFDAPEVQRLLGDSGTDVSGYPQADAYVALDPALHKVVVPRGLRDLRADRPPADVALVAAKASLVVRKDLHPAIEFLLLKAARQIHGVPGVFQRAGEFPAEEAIGLPLSDAARRFYRQDLPFLYNYLPYWVADPIGKAVFLLIPILGVLYPMMRFLPTLYDWTIRQRIRRLYGDLRHLDDLLKAVDGRDALDTLVAELAQLEETANDLKVPVAYANQLYELRHHISIVRAAGLRRVTAAPARPHEAPARQASPAAG